jgi:hypothetical protein
MVEVRISRESVEVLADEGTVGSVNRLDAQVLALGDSTDEVQASRVAIEVLGAEPPVGAATRLDAQVLALGDSPDEVQISRVVIEVLGTGDAEAAVSRLDASVLALGDSPAEVQISRIAGEALARQGSAGPVVPLALVDDAYVFLHNWATQAKLSTSFRTDVSISPDSGAESRRGLGVKPTRTLDLEWTICDRNSVTGINSLEQLERLEVLLRHLGDQRFQVPIYMDQQELDAAYLSTATTINVRTDQGRFFPGARIAIVQLDFCGQPVSHSFHQISDMTNTALTLTSTLGVAVAAGSLVFPVMDCEIVLDVTADYTTARVPSVKLTVTEAPGASQLPPIKSDNPSGAELAHDDRPVWYEEPDWTRGISKGRSRQGNRNRGGRADFVSVEGDRSRQTHRFEVTGNRDTIWGALEFFETRRGRLRSFWHIDQDQYFELVDIDAGGTFVGISENDLDLADTQEEFDALGLVMSDGKHYVTDVSSILQILTVFRFSFGNPLPAGLLAADAHRVARARLVRFDTDEFVETWEHTGYGTAGINIIEVLNEQDFEV